MRLVDEPAFVLHARRWRETSLLVEVLSAEHGRIGLVARGVQGPKKQALRAALQPLQSIRFSAVQRGELAQLRQAAGSVSRRDLEPLMAAAGAALPPPRVPTQIEYANGELRLRGLELAPEELTAMNQRLAAESLSAQPRDGALLVRAEDRP